MDAKIYFVIFKRIDHNIKNIGTPLCVVTNEMIAKDFCKKYGEDMLFYTEESYYIERIERE